VIKLAVPDIRQDDLESCMEVLQSGNLVQGVHVEQFEKSLAQSSDNFGRFCAVSSGTAALHLALKALGITRGDCVIVPDFTFPATANVVENLGAEVLFCDVDPSTYCVTPELIKNVISTYNGPIKALIVVHEFGYPAPIQSICDVAGKNNIHVIEDSACALGTVADGHHVGYYSACACFSFHPRKAITTGEGGAVLSKDESIIEKIGQLRNHGMKAMDGHIDFFEPGLNYRMTDFQAALALGQLHRFPAEIEKRRQLAELYQIFLQDEINLELPRLEPGHSYQSFMVRLADHINRQKVIDSLLTKGIQTNLGAQALHRLHYYQAQYGRTDSEYPISSQLYDYGLVLPLYGSLKEKEIRIVSNELKKVLNND